MESYRSGLVILLNDLFSHKITRGDLHLHVDDIDKQNDMHIRKYYTQAKFADVNFT